MAHCQWNLSCHHLHPKLSNKYTGASSVGNVCRVVGPIVNVWFEEHVLLIYPDTSTVLSRQISELRIYPAVDPLDSTARMLSPDILSKAY